MKIKYLTLALILFAGILWIGCSGSGIEGGQHPKAYKTALDMVNECRVGIDEITADELREKIEKREEFYLIDVRTESEFYDESIETSFHIPRGTIEFNIGSESYWDSWGMFAPEKDTEIVIYSKKGDRGALATDALIKLGYTKVKNLKGGWLVWKHGPDALEMEEAKASGGGCG